MQTEQEPDELPPCKNRIGRSCIIISTNYHPTREVCIACSRSTEPCRLNELTTLIQLNTRTPTEPMGDRLKAAVPWVLSFPKCGSCENRIDVINNWTQQEIVDGKLEILNLLRESAMERGVKMSDKFLSTIASELISHYTRT